MLADGGESNTGKFLLRSKGSSNDEFILSVIYKKMATHHTVVRDGGNFLVNKGPAGDATSLEEVRFFCVLCCILYAAGCACGRVCVPMPERLEANARVGVCVVHSILTNNSNAKLPVDAWLLCLAACILTLSLFPVTRPSCAGCRISSQ